MERLVEDKTFICKRCERHYAYPEVDARPIRCECGWWYFNDGAGIREVFWQRLEMYRTPSDVRKLFPSP